MKHLSAILLALLMLILAACSKTADKPAPVSITEQCQQAAQTIAKTPSDENLAKGVQTLADAIDSLDARPDDKLLANAAALLDALSRNQDAMTDDTGAKYWAIINPGKNDTRRQQLITLLQQTTFLDGISEDDIKNIMDNELDAEQPDATIGIDIEDAATELDPTATEP